MNRSTNRDEEIKKRPLVIKKRLLVFRAIEFYDFNKKRIYNI
jgi:hypothetical protein